jgi:multisubunit Na+/H+ antiporter MnhF subunit
MGSSNVGIPQAIPVSSIALAGFWIGFLACVLLLLDGPSYRMHLLGLYAALRIVIPAVLLLGLIAVLLSLIGLTRPGSKGVPFSNP